MYMLHMPFIAKLLISNLIIISCVLIGKRLPSLAGLIAAMPLTTLIVLAWLHFDQTAADRDLVTFVEGVLFGIIPTVLFFLTVWYCLRRGLPFHASISAGILIWLTAAAVHQAVMK